MDLALIDHALQALEQGRPLVRALIVQSSGSVPRSAGAAMVVFDDGSISGTVGGGPLEAASMRQAMDVLTEKRSRVSGFDLTGHDAARLGMICGGRMKVLLDYMEPGPKSQAPLKAAALDLGQRRNGYLLSQWDQQGNLLRRGLLTGPDDPGVEQFLGPRPPAGWQAKATLPYLVETGDGWVLVEPLSLAPVLYLLGAGHVAQATAHLAALVGFAVVVQDDREEFANSERFPQAMRIQVVLDYGQGLPRPLGPDDYVVVVTRGHLHDQEALAQGLAAGPGYLGMIGSLRKRDAIYANLLAEGVSAEALKQVHSPIGLNIGGDTPEEIALSIVAQMVAHRWGKNI